MSASEPRTLRHGGAAITWRPTPWDAAGLGVAATLELVALAGADPAELAAALAEVDAIAATVGAALATTRVDADAAVARAALASAGYVEVERSAALTLALVERDPRVVFGRAVAVAPATVADGPELGELAATAFDFSRFHEDPRIHPGRAQGRYRRWIVDSLGNGDEVWVHRHRGAIAALMSFRRRGPRVQLLLGGARPELGPLAPMFWAGVLARLRDEGVVVVDTRVSLANGPALRLHAAFGFAPTRTDVGATRIYDASTLASPPAGAPASPTTAERT
ncbi:MAG: hypothetical protein IPL61_00725 [Myxococcales bacterium]|nr:hypothetical protein [Myxococcales bacterium]